MDCQNQFYLVLLLAHFASFFSTSVYRLWFFIGIQNKALKKKILTVENLVVDEVREVLIYRSDSCKPSEVSLAGLLW